MQLAKFFHAEANFCFYFNCQDPGYGEKKDSSPNTAVSKWQMFFERTKKIVTNTKKEVKKKPSRVVYCQSCVLKGKGHARLGRTTPSIKERHIARNHENKSDRLVLLAEDHPDVIKYLAEQSGGSSVQPQAGPSVEPQEEPSVEPQEEPSVEPQEEPSVEPQEEPSVEPQEEPSVEPQEEPSVEPQEEPSVEPQEEPSVEPQEEPSVEPQEEPSVEPQEEPSVEPQEEPSVQPQAGPSVQPQAGPSVQPQAGPSVQPQAGPSVQPQAGPSVQQKSAPSILGVRAGSSKRPPEPDIELIEDMQARKKKKTVQVPVKQFFTKEPVSPGTPIEKKIDDLIKTVQQLSLKIDGSCSSQGSQVPIIENQNFAKITNFNELMSHCSFFCSDEEEDQAIFTCKLCCNFLDNSSNKSKFLANSIATGITISKQRLDILKKGGSTEWYHFKETCQRHVSSNLHRRAAKHQEVANIRNRRGLEATKNLVKAAISIVKMKSASLHFETMIMTMISSGAVVGDQNHSR